MGDSHQHTNTGPAGSGGSLRTEFSPRSTDASTGNSPKMVLQHNDDCERANGDRMSQEIILADGEDRGQDNESRNSREFCLQSANPDPAPLKNSRRQNDERKQDSDCGISQEVNADIPDASQDDRPTSCNVMSSNTQEWQRENGGRAQDSHLWYNSGAMADKNGRMGQDQFVTVTSGSEVLQAADEQRPQNADRHDTCSPRNTGSSRNDSHPTQPEILSEKRNSAHKTNGRVPRVTINQDCDLADQNITAFENDSSTNEFWLLPHNGTIQNHSNKLLQDGRRSQDGIFPAKDTEVNFDLNGGVAQSSTRLLDTTEEGKKDEKKEEDVGEERQTWDKKIDFLLAVIGFAIDLGNVWRFPYICYKNGGGAFLIPYLTMLVFLGLPLFYMELALGQFHRRGPITIWRNICPMFCGVGYAICVVASFVGAYYNTIIAWALYYLVMSLRSPLVYSSCDNDWNTPLCAAPSDGANRTNTSVSSVAEFFEYHVLESHRSTGIGNLGNIRWQLFLCLVVVFIIIFFCCWKGTKSTGKAVWVTATLPFFVLFVLLVRGVTLPGASTGIVYYLRPDFSRLATLEVWVDAAAQIFFSLGPGFGALIALSSYNKFHNNCFRDAVLTSGINCFTSFVAGIVVFAVLGYMAHVQGTTVEAVATHGPGLVFVVYAEAISTLGGSVFWAIIFFLMLITLGLDSTFGGLEGVMTALADEFTFFRKRRSLVVAVVCGYCFLTGLPTVTYGGTYFIYLMDTHAAPISLLFICFVEVIAVNWFYGARKFADDIKSMIGTSPSVFWLACWTIVCPLGLLLLFSLSFVGYERLSLDGYTYPWWAELVGWMVTLASIVCIPGYVVWFFLTSKGTCRERWRQMITPKKTDVIPDALPHNGQTKVEYGTIYNRHTAIQL